MQLQSMDLIDIVRTKKDYAVNKKKLNYEEMYKFVNKEYPKLFNNAGSLRDYFENEVDILDSGDDYDNVTNFSPIRELLNRNNISFTFDTLESWFFKYDEAEEIVNQTEQRPEEGVGIIVFEHDDPYFLTSIYNILKYNGANVELNGTSVIMNDAWEEQSFKFYYLKITGADANKLPATLKSAAITITDEGDYVFVEINDTSAGTYSKYYMNSTQRMMVQVVFELCKNDSWVIETDEKYYNEEYAGHYSSIYKKLIHMFGNTKEVVF